MPKLTPRDLCACAQVCKQWHAASMLVAQKQYGKHMLQHYECAGSYNAYISMAEHGPTPRAIIHAIQYNRTAFVDACVQNGHIPKITLYNRHTGDAANLQTYLHTCIEMSRDAIFTMLYMRGGWYFPNLLVTAAQKGNLHACKQMYWHGHQNLYDAIVVAQQGRKDQVAVYLSRGVNMKILSVISRSKKFNEAYYGEDEDIDLMCEVSLELF